MHITAENHELYDFVLNIYILIT